MDIEINGKNGEIGQIQGPFNQDDAIIFTQERNPIIKIGISLAEKDLMLCKANNEGFYFDLMINNVHHNIYIGREGIYETDDWISKLQQIIFPQGAPISTLIEYVIKTE